VAALERQIKVAQALLATGAVGFTPRQPVTFKSGIRSPMYIDNRRLPFWPQQWRVIIKAFQGVIEEQQLHFDVIAGIETGGIPHSSALGYVLEIPSVFVRKQTKEHGTKSLVEGGDVAGRRVLLIEDLVTTGGSSLAGVDSLRRVGALVDECLSITSYSFPEAQSAFEKANVRLFPLTSFSVILQEALKQGRFTQNELQTIQDWSLDPHGWADRHGF
jgi:orotate phosphoribosyltransferase